MFGREDDTDANDSSLVVDDMGRVVPWYELEDDPEDDLDDDEYFEREGESYYGDYTEYDDDGELIDD